MKKIIYYILPLSLLLLQSACITSLQPLVTADNIVIENRVAGTWQYKNDLISIGKMNESYIYKELTKMNVGNKDSRELPLQGKEKTDSAYYSKAWCITFKKNGATHYMAAAITRINDGLYMDLMPVFIQDEEQKPEGSGYELTNDYVPTFTIAKVLINNDASITLKFLNGTYIKEQVQANRLKISHQKDKMFDTFLVTASTDELRQFLQKYGNDDRLYSNENSVTLTRKG